MTAIRMDGKALAAKVRAEVAQELKEFGGPACLATVLVGDDPASHVYVGRKREACEEVGIASIHHEPDGSISQEDLGELVASLNAADEVRATDDHGLLA